MFFNIKDNSDEAKEIKDKRRNFPPPVYNEARLVEKPIPRLSLSSDESQAEKDEHTSDNVSFLSNS